MQIEKVADVGKLVLYFGAQCFMNVFMSWVLGTHVTLEKGYTFDDGYVLKQDLKGCPAGFALTAFQQMVSFIVFIVGFLIILPTKWSYKPKQLTTKFEVFCVIVFGCVFALNIALNNFSLGYIGISVNLIIRSCLPLTTFLSQQGLAMIDLYPFRPCKALEITLMFIGCGCAIVFTYAQIMGSQGAHGGGGGGNSVANQILGVSVCALSLLCGSLNLALAGVLGECKLNVWDTVAYMAIPATVFLLPMCYIPKPPPGIWAEVFLRGTNETTMTDMQILTSVWSVNKTTILWLVLSGVFSFMYNICQFSIVHTLSPSMTAFGGNFNKAFLIFMGLCLPFLQTSANPGAPWIEIIWVAVICNIAAFSWYSYLMIMSKAEKREKAPSLLPEEEPKTDSKSPQE